MKKSFLILVCITLISGFSFAQTKFRVKVDGKYKMADFVEETEYDINGNEIKYTDASRNNTSVKKYDGKGNLIYKNGSYYVYDSKNRLIYQGDREENYDGEYTSHWEYNNDGTVKKYRRGSKNYGTVIENFYDSDGKLIKKTCQDGPWADLKTATYEYDNDVLVYREDPDNIDGGTFMVELDDNGNIVYEFLEYGFDDEYGFHENRSILEPSNERNYEYDENNHLIYKSEGTVECTYEYDEAGNVIHETLNDDGTNIERYWDYEYKDGNIISYKKYLLYDGQEFIEELYKFDENGRKKIDYKMDYRLYRSGEPYCYEETDCIENTGYEYDDDGLIIKKYTPYDSEEPDVYIYVYEKHDNGKLSKKTVYKL